MINDTIENMKQNEHNHINAWNYVCSKVVGDLPPILPSNLISPKHYAPSKPLLCCIIQFIIYN